MKKIVKILLSILAFPFSTMRFVWIEVGVIRGVRCPACRHRRKWAEGGIDSSCYNSACSIYKHRDYSTPHDIYLN